MHPKERNEPYLRGRWPSINNVSQCISLPSRNAQWCHALIKCWHLTFRTDTCTLFSLRKSGNFPALWLHIKTLSLLCANIKQLADCAGAVMKVRTLNIQKAPCKDSCTAASSLLFYSQKCVAPVLLDAAPSQRAKSNRLVHVLCYCTRINLVTQNAVGQGERTSCGEVSSSRLSHRLLIHSV